MVMKFCNEADFGKKKPLRRPQISEQILVPDLYVLTVESVVYKKD